MTKLIKLRSKPNYEFILTGIVSSEPIYRISWLINELLGVQLKETHSIKNYNSKRQVIQEFSKYSYTTDEEFYIHLIQNKNEQGLFIEEQKHVDYWLKLDDTSVITNELLSQLNTLKNVNLAFDIKPGSLKSKTNLLFPNIQ